jgi:hypothetical protein
LPPQYKEKELTDTSVVYMIHVIVFGPVFARSKEKVAGSILRVESVAFIASALVVFMIIDRVASPVHQVAP